MSLPVAFEIASYSFFSSSNQTQDVIVIFSNNKGEVAKDNYNFIDAQTLKAVTTSNHYKQECFAHSETVLVYDKTETRLNFKHLIVINIDGAKKFSKENWLELGGVCRKLTANFSDITISTALPDLKLTESNLTNLFCGFKLRNYSFDKYQRHNAPSSVKNLTVNYLVADTDMALRSLDRAQNLADSVNLTRDLVNEPANILGTNAFINQIKNLAEFGLDVEILDKDYLEQAGFGALLGVAQGSHQPPYVAIIRWSGGEKNEAPLALVGKGVVFDSGGISLKTAAKMEDMKGDMGGAAAVVGTMRALAGRQAQINAIGIVGLVENMPSGHAQRPGDIVTSLSGQTIEITNTDAEGRLVLADLLWFTKETFKPKLMIDLATLTGAVTVALGKYYAGLFSNDQNAMSNLVDAGRKTGENLWPMPLAEAYDKKLKSRFADMINTAGREAGSIVAAQFLKRFVGETSWAHLDIAATAFNTAETAYNTSWATGFGVRLLDQMCHDFYELK